MGTDVSRWIYDVGHEEFLEKVVEASRVQPVLVDFWAPWCGPCRSLAPVLERLTEDFQGQFHVARVNVDEEPLLAREFQVQGIPYLLLFKDGKVVEQWVGAQPEGELRRRLKKHCPGRAGALLSEAWERWKEGKRDEAEKGFRAALEEDPSHPGALLGLANLAFAKGDLEEARALLEKIDPLAEEAEQASALKLKLHYKSLGQQFGEAEALLKAWQERPEDLELRYRLACSLVAEERYQEALQHFLEIVQQNRSFREDGGRKGMLDVFQIIGPRSPLADEYRTKLARTIF